MPETLICAHEFILLPCPPSQGPAVEELRQLVAVLHPETTARSSKAFWARKPGLVKAHLLVLAHTEGLGARVPRELLSDYKAVLSKCPLLAEEVHRISLFPRPPTGCGWAAPAMAAVETMQCLAQCLSLADRKASWAGNKSGGGPGDVAALLQLPHFDAEAVRRLRRAVKAPRLMLGAGGDGAGGAGGGAGGGGSLVAFADASGSVGADGGGGAKAKAAQKAAAKPPPGSGAPGGSGNGGGGGGSNDLLSARDLQAMDDLSRAEALAAAGLTPDQAEEAAAFLQALPEVALSVGAPEVDGEEGVCEGDPVRVRVRALLRRPAHALPGFSLRGKAVRALRQHPAELKAPPREEGWYGLLVDPSHMGVLAALPGPRTNLMEAERAALARPDAFAASAAAMARRVAGSGALALQAATHLVASGGASVVGAQWAARCERRRRAAEAKRAAAAAAAVTAAGGEGEAAAAAAQQQQRPGSAGSNKQLRRAASGRSGGGGGGGNGGGKDGKEEEADEHAALYADYGQTLDLVFRAPGEGTYNLLAILMSDAYVGADVCVPVKLVVTKLARRVEAAATEAAAAAAAAASAAAASAAAGAANGGAGGKKGKGGARPAADAESSEVTTRVKGGEEGSGDDDEDEDDEDDEDDDGHSYDSEETGSMETGPESDDVSSEGGADEGDASNSE